MAQGMNVQTTASRLRSAQLLGRMDELRDEWEAAVTNRRTDELTLPTTHFCHRGGANWSPGGEQRPCSGRLQPPAARPPTCILT